MKKNLSTLALLFAGFFQACTAIPAHAQFNWPTYPVHAPTQIYKIMVDNGSGVAIPATGDGTIPLGITQNSVVTSTGKVQLVTGGGPSQVQVNATTSVTSGELVTSDAHANVVAFSPTSDGAVHCSLGYVMGLGTGAGAPGTFVYVVVQPFCYQTANSASGGITSIFGNTGPTITTLTVPTGDSLNTSGTGTIAATSLSAASALPNGTTCTTQTLGDTTTDCATDAFVQNAINNFTPVVSFSAVNTGTNTNALHIGSAGSLNAIGTGTISANIYSPVGSFDGVGETGSISTTTLFTPTVSVLYQLQIYIAQATACANPGSGQVVLNLTWTDDVTTYSASSQETLQFVTTLNTAGGVVFETIPFFLTSGHALQYATVFTACATGSATYNIHLAINQL